MTTKIIKADVNDKSLDKKLKEAAEVISKGGLVVFPTETVYGLGADATNPAAALKIFEAKGRPSDNPLIIHIGEPTDAEKYTLTNETYYRIAERFMPGPITVILPAKDTVPMNTRAGLPTVAVRCPSNEIARRLIALSGVAIAAPSANLSGSPSPTKPSHVIDDMSGRVDIIIDGGACEIGLESTIVKIDDDGGLTLLRPGKITVDELLAVCAKVRIADAVTEKLKVGETAISPGMKYRHYAPEAPVYLLDADRENANGYLTERVKLGKRIAIIAYSDDCAYFKVKLPFAQIYEFGAKCDELTQARVLFDILREADKQSFDEIYAPLPRACGVGLALYNRMIRAAAHNIIRL